MKFDRIIERMVPGDVQAALATILRDHLTCECVDHRDVETHVEHLAKIAVEVLQPDFDNDDPDYIEFVNRIFEKDRDIPHE